MSAKFHQISLKVLLYYCCGLRLSEGRLLKWKHMDLENGVLSIFGSKGRKDRLVYLPEDSIPILQVFKEKQESEFKGIEWALPGANPEKPVSFSGVESCFRRHWAMVAAQTLDKHPTPHCLRHAFVVERWEK
uniref:tyrosine-type recombinase/integrase n=1 Tax=Enterocloster clostridioformis TaxID=1531 RepID=UPI0026EA352C|nr:tyrosine-type recombinase/integrase [Enterocloster clostridioformis]